MGFVPARGGRWIHGGLEGGFSMRLKYMQSSLVAASLIFSLPVQSRVDTGPFSYLPPDPQVLFELNAISLKKAFEELARETANSPVYKDSVRFSSALRQQFWSACRIGGENRQ